MPTDPTRPFGARGLGVRAIQAALLLSLAIQLTAAVPGLSQTDIEPAGETTLRVRLVADRDSCPAVAEIWLDQVSDSIAAFELYLSWDRPDFARFETHVVAPDTGQSAELGASPNPMRQPVLLPDSTTLRNWEYVEARGETGLWVKITAFSHLTRGSPAHLITPGRDIPLLRLPLAAARPQRDFLPGDLAVIKFDHGRTRLSLPDGQLVETIRLIDDSTRVSVCMRNQGSGTESPAGEP